VPRALRIDPDPTADTQPLTPRQRQVAELISRGYSTDGAARTLHVSTKTIEKHLGDIYRRLAIDSRTALAARWPVWPAKGNPPFPYYRLGRIHVTLIW
jgi:DNA-binding NarL/FixJ family response regulator